MLTPVFTINILDFLAMLSSVTSAWHNASAKRRSWVWMFLASFLNLCLYSWHRIWGHAMLDIFYLCCAFWGWRLWEHQHIKPSSLQTKALLASMIFVLFTLLSGLLHFLQGNVSQYDALSTAIALVALSANMHQMIDSWWLWIAHDVMNMVLTYKVKLPFQLFKQFLYILISFKGYRTWKGLIESQPSALDASLSPIPAA